MGKKGNKIDGFVTRLSRDMAACKLESIKWTDYQILICINTLLTNNKDEAKLAEKLTRMYNVHCDAKTSMTLASVQGEVKKFWRDKKETEDLMYSGSNNKPGSGYGSEKKKERRRRRKGGKQNKKQNELVAGVTSEDKNKEPYCFKCGEPDHTK